MYEIIQKKEIRGSIKRSNSNEAGAKLKLSTQKSDPKNITPLIKLKCGSGSYQKSILDPGYGLLNMDSLMKAHLIKARWDGINDENRITQWGKTLHEPVWSQNVETDIEAYIANRPVSESEIGDTYGITVTTVDSNLGESLMHSREQFNRTYVNQISDQQYKTAKTMLDNQTSQVTMRVDGTDKSINFPCAECIVLRLNPELDTIGEPEGEDV